MLAVRLPENLTLTRPLWSPPYGLPGLGLLGGPDEVDAAALVWGQIVPFAPWRRAWEGATWFHP